MNNKTQKQIEPLEDLTGELFVNRDEELKIFWKWANRIPNPANKSVALVGRRRTGKTSVLVKLYNRLFNEQERVMPVYISFARYLNRKKPMTSYDFGREYLTGYMKSYLAFQYKLPYLMGQQPTLDQLNQLAIECDDEYAQKWYIFYQSAKKEHTPHDLVQGVINLPRGEARLRDMPTAMIVDEFQVLTNVYDPTQDVHYDITDSFQWAADTFWAPMCVSGSAVTLLVWQALGGMLSGRFKSWYLKPFNQKYSHELVFRLGRTLGVKTDETLSEAIWKMTGGYPYSIHCLMTSFSSKIDNYPSLDALEQVIKFELTDTRGGLWQHYSEEFEKYSNLLNTGQVAKKVMFWTVKYPGERIDAERIAEEVGIEFDAVQDALRKLLQADIVQKIGWTLYEGPSDPMLRRYIEHNYRQEVEKLSLE